MKKNYLKRLAATFAAAAVMTATASSMSVFAAEGDYQIDIDDDVVTLGEAETVDVDVKVLPGTEYTVNSLGVMLEYDTNLKIKSTTSPVGISEDGITVRDGKLLIAAGGDKQFKAGDTLLTITFEVPAEVGKYNVNFAENFNKLNLFNTEDPTYKSELVPHELIGGYVEVKAPEVTTVTTVTTPEPTTTSETTTTSATTSETTTSATTSETTTSATTSETTTTSATTSATTTSATTKATTTTTKKVTTSNSPNTGNSTEGVAALAATMVAAAGAAVVFKKKKD